MQWQDRMALDHAFSALKKPSKAVMVPSRVLHLKQVIELTAAPRRRDRVAYQGKIFDEEAILGMVEPVLNVKLECFVLSLNEMCTTQHLGASTSSLSLSSSSPSPSSSLSVSSANVVSTVSSRWWSTVCATFYWQSGRKVTVCQMLGIVTRLCSCEWEIVEGISRGDSAVTVHDRFAGRVLVDIKELSQKVCKLMTQLGVITVSITVTCCTDWITSAQG